MENFPQICRCLRSSVVDVYLKIVSLLASVFKWKSKTGREHWQAAVFTVFEAFCCSLCRMSFFCYGYKSFCGHFIAWISCTAFFWPVFTVSKMNFLLSSAKMWLWFLYYSESVQKDNSWEIVQKSWHLSCAQISHSQALDVSVRTWCVRTPAISVIMKNSRTNEATLRWSDQDIWLLDTANTANYRI